VNSPESIRPVLVAARQMLSEASQYSVDMRDVHGQQAAKRALEVACAGGTTFCLLARPGPEKRCQVER
jgi:magnesium chelatase family protein